jgi:hypothetical protein
LRNNFNFWAAVALVGSCVFFQGGAGCLTSLPVCTFNARITAIKRPCSAFGGQSNVQSVERFSKVTSRRAFSW